MKTLCGWSGWLAGIVLVGWLGSGAMLWAQSSTLWNFNSSPENWWWSAGGYATFVSDQGKTADGCLLLSDATAGSNPYAKAPAIAANHTRSYALTGYYKPNIGSSDVLGAGYFLLDANSAFMSVSLDCYPKMQTSIYSDDANGWRKFVFRVPKSVLAASSGMAYIQWFVRPVSSEYCYTEAINAAQGSAWFDDLRHEEWLEDTINLKPVMTAKHTDDNTANNNTGGWIDQGANDFRNLPLTETELFNIPFEFVNPDTNGNKSILALCGIQTEVWYTDQNVQVPLANKPYDRIYLLHTSIGGPSGSTIGEVIVTYSNDTTETKPIRVGCELADWTGGNLQGKTQAWTPCKTASTTPVSAYLYATSLELQRPIGTSIVSLIFRASTGSTTPWMIFAASGATGSASWLDIAEEATTDTSAWVPFVPSISPTATNAVNLGALMLDPPAGKHGVVKIVNGHLEFDDGTPVRFWGTNIHGYQDGIFPTHTQADQIADTLARYGINLVRLHMTETVLIDHSVSNRTTFIDDAKWEKFEYFFHALKQNGIYILMESVVGLSSRGFLGADDIYNIDGIYAASLANSRSWAYYDSTMQNLGLGYMNMLLTHPNRYEDNTSLGQDPALAAVTIINERSVFWDQSGPLFTGTAADHYKNILKTQFNAWLLNQYTNRAGLAAAWMVSGSGTALGIGEDPSLGTVEMEAYAFYQTPTSESGQVLARAVVSSATETQRIRTRDNVRFLQYIQGKLYADFSARAAILGVQCPIIGTNMTTDLAELKTHLLSGITAQNHYWNHVGIDAMVNHNKYEVLNIPETTVNPLNRNSNSPSEVCFTATKTSGCAMAVTETDAMWPNEWRASHMMNVAAYSALQDHDLVLHYAFHGGGAITWNDLFNTTYEHIFMPSTGHHDPAMLSGMLAGAFLFLRGDVQTAPSLVQLQVDGTLELAMQNNLYLHGGYPANYLTYVTRFENVFLSLNGGTPPAPYESGSTDGMTSSGTYVLVDRGNEYNVLAEERFRKATLLDVALKNAGMVSSTQGLQNNNTKLVSVTGELERDWGNQIVKINTPKSQGFTGFPNSAPIAFDDLSVISRSSFATFQVSSLDNQSLDISQAMFLIAVSRAENQVDGNRRYTNGLRPTPMGIPRAEGLVIDSQASKGPVLVEPVRMTVQMSGVPDTTGGYFRFTPLKSDLTPSSQVAVFPVNTSNQSQVILDNAVFSPWNKLERLANVSHLYDFNASGDINNGSTTWGWGGTYNILSYDVSKSHSGSGCVKLNDIYTSVNPNITSPLVTDDKISGYRFSGWFVNDTANPNNVPAVRMVLYNSECVFYVNIFSSSPGVSYVISDPDANGWRKFVMYVPRSLLASAASSGNFRYCRFVVGSSSAAYTWTGMIWMDDFCIEKLQGKASAWDYAADLQCWGWSGGGNIVCWESSKGHFENGSIKLEDASTIFNGVVTSPVQIADKHHGYRFSGWYWSASGMEPGLGLVFYATIDGTGTGVNANNEFGGSITYEVSLADANGWKRFAMYVPSSYLSSATIQSVRCKIAPAPNTAGNTFTGSMWVDDITLEMIPE